MKRLVLSGAPLLKKLIESLRAAAPEVFNTLIFQSVKGVTSPEALDNKTVAKRISGPNHGVSDSRVKLRNAAGRAGIELRSTGHSVSTTT